MTPVIELKGKNNTEYYSEIVELANQFEVNPVYISFHIENLQTMRRLTQCKMYYLVQKISEDDIQDAKSIENCGIDFNGNKDKNFKSDIIKNAKMPAWSLVLGLLTKKTLFKNLSNTVSPL